MRVWERGDSQTRVAVDLKNLESCFEEQRNQIEFPPGTKVGLMRLPESRTAPLLELYSPLWQADRTGINRYAPLEFIQRYLGAGFFDYGIADEVHELKGGTAQGSALASLLGASPC